LRPGEASNPTNPDFQATLEASVLEGLRYVLGESGLQMVLRMHPLPSLSSNPAEFHEAMVDIFKEGGAQIIEREIARRLLQKTAMQEGREQPHHHWFTITALGGSSRGKVSSSERRVLKRFVALASLPNDHRVESASSSPFIVPASNSIELTSLRFAAAFKK
jgi:hypothetical protein